MDDLHLGLEILGETLNDRFNVVLYVFAWQLFFLLQGLDQNLQLLEKNVNLILHLRTLVLNRKDFLNTQLGMPIAQEAVEIGKLKEFVWVGDNLIC